MANRYAVATGNWSNTATWNGGTLPQAGDDVRANGFTVTIDQDITVTSLQTTAFAPAAAGGSFVINATGRTITANIIPGTTTVLTYNGAFTLSLIGNVFGGSPVTVSSNNTSSILNFIGNCTGGSGFGSHGISTSGTINMTGDCLGGNNNNNALNLINSTAVANITGNVTGGPSGGRGIDSAAGTSINITGNITGGGSSTPAIGQTAISANIVVNGNIIGGGAGSVGINLGGGTLSGNFVVYGSSNSSAAGINVIGGTAIVKQIIFSSIGTSPVIGRNILFDNNSQLVTILKQNNSTVSLVDSSIGNPATTDVRSGVSYANGALTGTLAVPSPSNVASGVPTDNTVGTAALTPADFWDYLTSGATAGSMGERVAAIPTNPASVESTGAQIASFNT